MTQDELELEYDEYAEECEELGITPDEYHEWVIDKLQFLRDSYS